ncbi:MAG: S9 family peptidase, partial [Bacteroidota bacterium]|nr:S9 family peptidase [Bacteroidota bacterium]
MKLFLLLALFTMISVLACKSSETTPEKMQYPVTEKSDHVDTYHGIEVADPYRWLEDDTSKATGAWVEAQNKVTFGYLDKIAWRPELKKRLESLINYERISAPFREGNFEY